MSATLEISSQQTHVFDWDLAEAQFYNEGYFRPPENEIYGRSLSTVRRLGAFMIGKAQPEVIVSPEASQVKVEFFTSVQEGFGTDMELGGGLEVRDFDVRPVVGGKVMAKDNKTAISVMTQAGLACAFETAKKDEHFVPQLTRSKWDHENALIVDEMAKGKTDFDTRIVISPFPDEGAAQSGDEYWQNIGYVPHLRRGFVQLYHVSNDGELISGSLSFDGSDKRQLRNVFRQFGIEIPDGETTDNWLQYAITGNFSADNAKDLATTIANMASDPRYKKSTNTVDVTGQYTSIMERAFNESYVHICESLARGRQTAGAKALISQLAQKAQNFNHRYSSALKQMEHCEEGFTDDDSVVLHELLVYSTIEMIRALHIEQTQLPDTSSGNYAVQQVSAALLQTADPASFQNMLGGFGADGARNNRVYSACGLKVAAGGKNQGNNSESGPQSAYGGVDGGENAEAPSNSGSIRCINCREFVPKKRVVKKDCWECPKCQHKVDICTGEVRRQGVSRQERLMKVTAAAIRADRKAEAAAKVEEVLKDQRPI